MKEDGNKNRSGLPPGVDQRLRRKQPAKQQKSPASLAPVDKVLPGVLSGLGLERRLREHALMQLWASLLPEALANSSRPLFIDHQHNLVIAVSNASAAQELSLIKGKLMQALEATARSLDIKLVSLRFDLKNFHRPEEKPVPEESPLPQPSDSQLAELTLKGSDIELIGILSAKLEAETGRSEDLKIMVLRAFEKQLRLAEWRRRHGFPVCQSCGNPVARLFVHETHKVCFNCLQAQKHSSERS